MKKIMFTIISFFFVIPNIKATCSDEEMIRIANVAKNINISYMYNEDSKTFEVTFTNINKEILITNLNDNKVYNQDIEMTLKGLKSGKYKFNISAKDVFCSGDSLTVKYIDLPYYNRYFDTEDCNGIKEFSYCNKWVQNEISEDIFKTKVKEYKKNLYKKEQSTVEEKNAYEKIKKIIVNIYVNYYYIILPLIITLLCVIIYLKDKSEQLI